MSGDPTGGLSAVEIISRLSLEPHPEGGHFRETFRDSGNSGGRAISTAIFYLLQEGEISRWHRVDASEVWHYHAGSPLELTLADEKHARHRHVIGLDLEADERPQQIVPAGCWQMARSLGAWTLVGCTVAPGFEFSGFEMAPEGWEP